MEIFNVGMKREERMYRNGREEEIGDIWRLKITIINDTKAQYSPIFNI